jgi:hypothetical protein
MKIVQLLPALLLALFLSGCATTGGKTLSISSEPSAAKVAVFDRQGRSLGESVTPISLAVRNEFAYIEISSEGYSPRRIVFGQDVKKKFNPLYLLNFALAGAGAGAGIALNQAADSGGGQFAKTASYYAFGLGVLGLAGAVVDPIAGSLVKISPRSLHIKLQAAQQ